jgi:pimeloyl-ACP methyl ester carboxylesterase
MIALAEKLFNEHNWDIHLFALEHRYYGESVPSIVKLDQDENDSDSEDASDYEKYSDFTYLSSRQAVHDIAQFVKSPEAAMHLGESPENVRWIAFGGSYPGMLSAWSRLLFPDIIHGAVANSAPVQAELAFTQYYDHVASDLADEDVGGSEECQRIFVEGHEEIVSVLEKSVFPNDENAGTDPLDFIATLFNVCDGADALRESPRNIEMLIEFLLKRMIHIVAESCVTFKSCVMQSLDGVKLIQSSRLWRYLLISTRYSWVMSATMSTGLCILTITHLLHPRI